MAPPPMVMYFAYGTMPPPASTSTLHEKTLDSHKVWFRTKQLSVSTLCAIQFAEPVGGRAPTLPNNILTLRAADMATIAATRTAADPYHPRAFPLSFSFDCCETGCCVKFVYYPITNAAGGQDWHYHLLTDVRGGPGEAPHGFYNQCGQVKQLLPLRPLQGTGLVTNYWHIHGLAIILDPVPGPSGVHGLFMAWLGGTKTECKRNDKEVSDGINRGHILILERDSHSITYADQRDPSSLWRYDTRRVDEPGTFATPPLATNPNHWGPRKLKTNWTTAQDIGRC